MWWTQQYAGNSNLLDPLYLDIRLVLLQCISSFKNGMKSKKMLIFWNLTFVGPFLLNLYRKILKSKKSICLTNMQNIETWAPFRTK